MEIRKAKTTLILLLLSIGSVVAQAADKINYTRQDSIDVMQMMAKAKKLPATENLFLEIAKMFIDRPYVGHTLDKEKKERLVVNVREVDCTTYIEYVLAIYQCVKNKKTTFNDFCNYLADIRYVGGKIDYPTRQHYFTLWINDNINDGFIREITAVKPPFTAVQTVNVDYMTTHVSSYYMLKNNPEWKAPIRKMERDISGKRYRYIPKSRLTNTRLLRQTIKNGDIIAILTSKKGLDTSHIGVAVWRNDGLHLLNASSIHKKVIIEPMTLFQYMKKHPTFTGIRVVRCL